MSARGEDLHISEGNYRIELWKQDRSEMIANVNTAANHAIHTAAWQEAIHEFPGFLLIAYNGRFKTDEFETPTRPAGRREATFGDLSRFHLVQTWCGICKRSNMFEAGNFAERFGKDTTIKSVEGRLKCKQCGSREHVSLRIFKKPR
ncbi:hypothetical protein [Limoniibacter endophyticus]|uniref:Uncharacterized protein n=1 Tax=Limoniibacter endophyticus TaxID=1565040 RepID=A0A8J3DUS9_9HYPH|nr:hypothetical protein [Limoniibacter endophyticus]GHC79235.1 hypothetical protein GCM10010136_31630 [Limoniibacter endophyticus]